MKNILLTFYGLGMLTNSIAQSITQDSFSLTEVMEHIAQPGRAINVELMPTTVVNPNGETQKVFKKKISIREIPAQYVEEQIKLAPNYKIMFFRENAKVTPNTAGETIQLIPPRYDTIVEKVKIQEISYKWVKKKFDQRCLSMPITYKPFVQTFVLIQFPSLYVEAKWYKCVENAKIIRKKGAEIKIDTIFPPSDLLDAAHYPAQYELIHRKMNDNDFIITTKDTFYQHLKGVTTLPKNTFSWREVACAINFVTHPIMDLQIALKLRHYYDGELNNRFDATTQKALVQFQQDHHLKVGFLDMETIRVLYIFPKHTDGIHEED